MARNIFLDFDGTLIDSRLRQYELFKELVPECKLTFDCYWDIKRQRVSQSQLLSSHFNYSEAEITRVRWLWAERIEEPERLLLDVPFDGIDEMLHMLVKQHNLFLVTARQRADLVGGQIMRYGWHDLFSSLLVTEQRMKKSELIQNNITYSADDVIVGDTGEDIIEGKSLGIRTAAVDYGILNYDVLVTYEPDAVVSSPAELAHYLRRLGTASV